MARRYDNASTQATEFVDDADLRPTTALALAGWFRPTPFDGNGGSFLAGKLRTAFSPSYGIRRGASDTTYHFMVYIAGAQVTADTSPITGDTWYYYFGHWQSGSNLALYIYNNDGSFNQSVTSAGTVSGSIEHGAQPFVIGRDMFGYWSGDAERVRLYDSYLSVAALEALQFVGDDDPTAKLHAQLILAGSSETDVSGNNSAGSHINSPALVSGPSGIVTGGGGSVIVDPFGMAGFFGA